MTAAPWDWSHPVRGERLTGNERFATFRVSRRQTIVALQVEFVQIRGEMFSEDETESRANWRWATADDLLAASAVRQERSA